MNIKEIEEIVKVWAIQKPLVKRVYLFGSRVRGNFRPDSDIDIAVELYLGGDDESVLATWMFEEDEIRVDLQDLLPFKLHLELLDGNKTPVVLNAVRESGKLVYENRDN